MIRPVSRVASLVWAWAVAFLIAGAVSVTESSGITVGAVDGVTGIDADTGTVAVEALAGGLTVSNDIDNTTTDNTVTLTVSGNDQALTVDTAPSCRWKRPSLTSC